MSTRSVSQSTFLAGKVLIAHQSVHVQQDAPHHVGPQLLCGCVGFVVLIQHGQGMCNSPQRTNARVKIAMVGGGCHCALPSNEGVYKKELKSGRLSYIIHGIIKWTKHNHRKCLWYPWWMKVTRCDNREIWNWISDNPVSDICNSASMPEIHPHFWWNIRNPYCFFVSSRPKGNKIRNNWSTENGQLYSLFGNPDKQYWMNTAVHSFNPAIWVVH